MCASCAAHCVRRIAFDLWQARELATKIKGFKDRAQDIPLVYVDLKKSVACISTVFAALLAVCTGQVLTSGVHGARSCGLGRADRKVHSHERKGQ